MRVPEEWPSRVGKGADRTRLTGRLALFPSTQSETAAPRSETRCAGVRRFGAEMFNSMGL